MSGGKYDDMLSMPHHTSKTRPHMTNLQRAAQFSAFAALKGFDEEIAETARYTEEAVELFEERQTELGATLSALKRGQEVSVRYFLPDAKKEGGAFLEKRGTLKKIDEIAHKLLFFDGESIPFRDIIELIPLSSK